MKRNTIWYGTGIMFLVAMGLIIGGSFLLLKKGDEELREKIKNDPNYKEYPTNYIIGLVMVLLGCICGGYYMCGMHILESLRTGSMRIGSRK
jgi:hypothetical protein